MRFGVLLREALADIVSGTTRAGVLAVVIAALVGGVVMFDAFGTRSLVEDAREFRAAGAATFVFAAAGAVDPVACEALNRVDGVQAAGALRSPTVSVALTVLPASPIAIWEVSPGFAAVLGASGAGEGPLVSREVADATGLELGAWIATASGPLFAAAVYDYPADGRRVGLGWAALLPRAEREPFDECWVSTWPYDDAIRQMLSSVVQPNAAADPSFSYDVVQLNERLGTTPSGAHTLANRVTGSAPILVAALGGVLGWLGVQGRRREFASRLHHGSHRTTVVTLVVLETTFWAGCGIGLVCVGAVGVGLLLPFEDGHAIVVTGALTAAVGGVSAVLGAIGRAMLLRERDLFRYFQES